MFISSCLKGVRAKDSITFGVKCPMGILYFINCGAVFDQTLARELSLSLIEQSVSIILRAGDHAPGQE